jgi:hypothetical protein
MTDDRKEYEEFSRKLVDGVTLGICSAVDGLKSILVKSPEDNVVSVYATFAKIEYLRLVATVSTEIPMPEITQLLGHISALVVGYAVSNGTISREDAATYLGSRARDKVLDWGDRMHKKEAAGQTANNEAGQVAKKAEEALGQVLTYLRKK